MTTGLQVPNEKPAQTVRVVGAEEAAGGKQHGLAPSDSDKFPQSSSVKICLIFVASRSGVGPHHSPIIWQQNIRGEQWARFS